MMDDERVDEEEEVIEPQLTSTDPEERKLARALRITRRWETMKKIHVSEGDELLPEEERSLLERQIEVSSELLQQYRTEGEEAITNVRIGNEGREVNRRDKEAAHRAELLETLEQEAIDAEEKYQAISRKWDILAKYKDPLDIHESIMSQKGKCKELIIQKDEIIAMLREEVNIAEIKYRGDQDLQADDITTLVQRIDAQVDAMQRHYRTELRLIEDTIGVERKLRVETNAKKWDMLQKQRNEAEEFNMHKTIELADEYLDSSYRTRVDHEEKYRETKIVLERESEELQKELETLKSACLLNGEKLDYNYQILKKREEENIIIRSQQKRLINKLQDEINLIKYKINSTRTEAEETILKRSVEIKKMRDNVFAVEAKTLHITQVNDRKYHQVWALNEGVVRTLTQKIYTTDKIIYEQLLGQDWKHPRKKLIPKTKLPSYVSGVKVMDLQNNPDKFKPVDKNPFEDSTMPPSLIKSILKEVANRSGFLIERLLRNMLPQFPEDDQTLIKIDNIFDVLGIKKSKEFDLLIQYFLPYIRCPICEEAMDKEARRSLVAPSISSRVSVKKDISNEHAPALPDITYAVNESPLDVAHLVDSELQMSKDDATSIGVDVDLYSLDSSQDMTMSVYSQTQTASFAIIQMAKNQGRIIQCNAKHPVYVESSCIYKTLKEFITDTQGNEVKHVTPVPAKQNTLSRLMSKEDVQIFWGQFSHIFSKSNDEIWNGLLFGLKKYYNVLRARHKLLEEVAQLKKENKELSHLLRNCPLASIRRTKEVAKQKKRKAYSQQDSTSTYVSLPKI